MKSIGIIYNLSFSFFIILVIIELFIYKDFKSINDFVLKTIIYFTFPVLLIPIKDILPILVDLFNKYKEEKNEIDRKKNYKSRGL